MKSRPIQYLGLALLLLASLGVIYLPITSAPEPQDITIPVVAPKPFTEYLATKEATPPKKPTTAPTPVPKVADVADETFVKEFKTGALPGSLTVGTDPKTATVADKAATQDDAKTRANQIITALDTKFKGVQLAPTFAADIAKLPVKPLLPLGDTAIYPPRTRDGKVVPAIKLGLDLQGGVNLVLQVRRAQFPFDVANIPTNADARAALVTQVRTALNSTPEDLGLRNVDVNLPEKSNRIDIRTQAKDKAQFDAQNKALTDVMAKVKGFTITPGRAQFYQVQDEAQKVGFGSDYTSQLLDRTVEILRGRVDKLGVSEPLIQKQLPDRIVVQLPGVNDPQKAVEVLGKTAQMKIVLAPTDLSIDQRDPNNVAFIYKGNPITGEQALELCEKESASEMQRLGLIKTAEPQPIVAGIDVKPTTNAGFADAGRPAIFFELQGAGVKQFADVTRDIAGKNRQIPIFLDDKCITAPNVESAITGGKGQISGGFDSIDEARSLAILLNSGALPAPIDVIENRTVSATLGNDSLVKSLRAGLIGLIAVAIFMIAYYRLPGVLANCALVVYCILNLATFILIGGTLTLPGIAGFLLGLAMSLDTNILVFERLKEEMAIQPTFAAALRAAFNRAWTAILDSHVTTLIAATVLFYFGTGPVKGFALTLGVGVLLSLFSAISVTRLFMWSAAGLGERNRSLFASKLPAPHDSKDSKVVTGRA